MVSFDEEAPDAMKCRNGLHEIDPDNPWRGPSGARCRSCFKARQARELKRYKVQVLNGNHALRFARYAAAHPEKVKAQRYKSNRSPRHHAHNLCRKYGVKLRFFDNYYGPGRPWYPPEIREALSGTVQDQATG